VGRKVAGITDIWSLFAESGTMPSGLHRYQQSGDLHFITFSCYRRQQKLKTALARSAFERSLEQTRRAYNFCVLGYVVMPEHVHLLLSEPPGKPLSLALQALKQSVARSLALRAPEPFWQSRYYDFNVWSAEKHTEKLKYMHRNPVTRGLVEKPDDWPWSSYCHYLTGEEGMVEIESQWTAFKRERMGLRPQMRSAPMQPFPP
jgi:putative transposase